MDTNIFILILTTSTIGYSACLLLSIVLYYISTPNLIYKLLTSSLISTFNDYAYVLIGWFTFCLIYLYLHIKLYCKCEGTRSPNQYDYKNSQKQRKKREKQGMWDVICTNRLKIMGVMLTLIFIQSYVVLKIVKQSNRTLYSQFKFGMSHVNKQNGIYSTNYDRSWPGWMYYFSDQYYQQTKNRIEENRAKFIQFENFQQILSSLKDLHSGVHTTKSWLMNHRMMYDGLIITYESAGLLFLILIWAFCLFDKLCKKVRAKMCCNIGLFLSIWVVVIVFGLLSEGLHSIIVLNNHQICQYKPNSGAFNIIINKASSDYINSLNLNVVEDPNNIYRFLCHNLQRFHQKPLANDQIIIKYVFNMAFIGFLMAALLELGWVILQQRRVQEYKQTDVQIKQKQSQHITQQPKQVSYTVISSEE